MPKVCVCARALPSFGWSTATHCTHCKVSGMRDMRSRMCEECNQKEALYGIVTPSRCRGCSDPGMENLKHPRCLLGCGTHVRRKGLLCAQCNPAIRSSTRYWELTLRDYFQEQGLEYVSHNGMHGPYRPDFVFMRSTFVIIVECDEHQHIQYDRRAEDAREQTLASFFYPKAFIIIRFNPNAFTRDGRTMRVSFRNRCIALQHCLRTLLDNQDYIPSQAFTKIYMYYDSP